MTQRSVLHLAHGYFPESAGGVESYLRDVMLAQRAAGVDARLLVGSHTPWPEAGIERIEVDGLEVDRLHRDDLFFDLFSKQDHPGVEVLLRDHLRATKPDLVHVHQWIRTTGGLCALAGELGIPSVLTLHDLYSSCPRCFRVRPDGEHCDRVLSIESCLDCVPRYGHESRAEIELSIHNFADHSCAEFDSAGAMLVASRATAELVGRGLGVDPDRFERLPLAYAPRFGGADKVPGPQPGEVVRFAYWGNLTERKGVPMLVRGFRELCAEVGTEKAELHLFGRVDTAALESELTELAAGLPIRFHGRFEYEQLQSTGLHVAVFPMICFETYGFVLDEAFELGLTPIVTQLGAMPERIGEGGLLVPPRDPSALALAMRRFLDEPDLWANLRAAAPEGGMSLAEHVDALDSIYSRVSKAGAKDPVRIATERRLELLRLQRESAQERITPEGGPQ